MIIAEYKGITVPHFNTGQAIKIKLENKIVSGKVKFAGEKFLTIQCNNYQESISYSDIITGRAKIM